MARFPEDAPAIIGLEGRGSRFAWSRRSRTLISTRPPRGNEEMTLLGVRALSRPGGDRGAHARVVALDRVFHQVGPFEFLDTAG